jgi:hypothetical protein
MKRSDLQQKIKDRIEMRIREGHYASDTADYERWAFAHFLADELISLIEKQGMLPPAIKVPTTGQEDGEVFELNLLVNEWEPEEEST